ncbi:hypothetical protein ACJW31_04G045100 [Castanea mollissima]
MAGLYDKRADFYVDARPTYPTEWYSMLAALTPHHSLAWDVRTGNGQVAIGVAKHYELVVGTDVNEARLKLAMPHPCIRYLHTSTSVPDDELVDLIGGENSVDLVTVATAIYSLELPKFYTIVKRLLKKPGGVIAVWGYYDTVVSPIFDPLIKRFRDSNIPYLDLKTPYGNNVSKPLPFPFESVGLGCEGEPRQLDMSMELSLENLLTILRSWSSVTMAKDQGVDLLSESAVKEFESAWGAPTLVRSVICKSFMLAGKVRL